MHPARAEMDPPSPKTLWWLFLGCIKTKFSDEKNTQWKAFMDIYSVQTN
jgi:hypothetical protein